MDRSDLPIEAVKIDGQYIEDAISGYKTVLTSGREGLAPEKEKYSVGTADGEVIKYTRYPAREIKVDFALHADSLEDLRDKLNHLNNIFQATDADFVFNDESGVFYTGDIIVSEDFKPYKNAVTGSYTIYCAYPFKRSVEPITLSTDDSEGVQIDGNMAVFTFDYNGTYPSRPVLQAEFAGALSGGDSSEDGDCGFVAFMDADENIIQLGNPDAVDLDQYTSADTLINRDFTTLAGWTAGGTALKNITDTYWNKGAGQTRSFAYGGTLSNTTTGAVNLDLAIVQRLCVSTTAQLGSFECGMYSASNVLVVGYRIKKTASGTTASVEYVINGTVAGKDNIDVSYYNTNFGYCKRTALYRTQYYNKKKKAWQNAKISGAKTRKVSNGYSYTQSNLNSSVKKSGASVTIKVGNLAARTFQAPDIENTVSKTLKFTFTGDMNTNAVASARLASEPTASFADTPNVFLSGDIVEADCSDASVFLMRKGTVEGRPAPQYGALGNDWEDFTLVKGENVIGVTWSDWVHEGYEPTIRIIYNEVFL